MVVRDERDKLIKQLVQVEMDAKAASEQLVKMKDTVRKLKEVNLQNLINFRLQRLFIILNIVLGLYGNKRYR